MTAKRMLSAVLVAVALFASVPAFSTVSSTSTTVSYTGTGSAPLPVPFPFFQASDLVVTANGVPVAFTVTGTPRTASASVVLASVLSTSQTISITRSVPLTQPMAFPSQGAFSPKSHEAALDRLAMQVQDEGRKWVASDAALAAAEYAARTAADAAIIASGAMPADVGIAPVVATGSLTARTVAARFGESVNILDHGADPTGASDSVAAIGRAEAAAVAGQVIFFPAGTYLINSAWTQSKDVIYRGAGRATVLKMGASSGDQLFTQGGNFAFEDMTFDLQTRGSAFAINGLGRFRVSRCRFVNQSATRWTIPITGGKHGTIEGCEFVGRAGATQSYGIMLYGGSSDVAIRDNRFLWQDYAVYAYPGKQGSKTIGGPPATAYAADAGRGQVSDVRFTDNYADGGWWLWATRISGGSGATYTSTSLTDNAQTWGSAAGETIRVLPVVTSGTGTFSASQMIDSGASFLSTLEVGQLVRADGAQAVVTRILSNTTVEVDEWLSVADLAPKIPALNSTYSVRDVIVSSVNYPGGVSGQVLNVSDLGWSRVRNGAVVTSIPANTEYELCQTHGQYAGVGTNSGATGWTISGNTVRRSWADAISYVGDFGVVVGNNLYDNKDVGITIGIYSATPGTAVSDPGYNAVVGNVIKRQGAIGISVLSSDNLVSSNVVVDYSWRTAIGAMAGIDLNSGAARNLVIGNRLGTSTNLTGNSPYGIVVTNLYSDGNNLIANQVANNATASIYLYQAASTLVMNNALDGSVTLAGGATLAAEPTPMPLASTRVTYASNWDGTGLAYLLDRNGSIQFLGGAHPSVGAGAVVGNVPAPYRPTGLRWMTLVRSGSPGSVTTPVFVSATITTDGDVTIKDDVATVAAAAAGIYYSFDGVSYRMEAP